MNKELNRMLLLFLYSAVLYLATRVLGFEIAVIIGIAWLIADRSVNDIFKA